MENNQEKPKVIYEVKYRRPVLHRRVLANLIDLLLLVLLFFTFFISIRAIVSSTPKFNEAKNTIEDARLTSGLFVQNEKTKNLTDIVTWISSQSTFSASDKNKHAIKTIDTFITFSNPDLTPKYGNSNFNKVVLENYDKFFLSDKLVYKNNIKYFIKDDSGVIIRNPECPASEEEYFSNTYAVFIDSQCQNLLVSQCTPYYQSNRYMSLMLFALEIPVSYCVSGLLVYVLPVFIFKRNRQTIGKLVYRIGLVDGVTCFHVSNKKMIARTAIVYFGEVVLSLFTFAIPMFVSFSLMVFSKKQQSFPDYMLNLTEIDLNSNKIYYSYDEITIDQIDSHKKPIDFKSDVNTH